MVEEQISMKLPRFFTAYLLSEKGQQILLFVINQMVLFLYTVAQNKPDSTNQAIVSCCESYFKKNFNTIQELYVRKVLEILFVILGLKLCLN